MRMGDDGPPPACAFVLDGYIEELLSSVIVQSSTILIDYNETHEGKTYRSEGEGGEVPNRLYEVIDGDGTYDFYPGGLSTGAKAGIGAGVGVGVIGLLVLGFFFWWRRRRQKAKVAAAAGTASAQAQTPTEEKGGEEARTAELGGNHVSELEDKHNHPRHEMGPGVERAELGGDQMHHRFELPT
ncbi:hypothetical protein B0T20DRAFT_115178 [Sordaria brevicollis]|uniref:Uncharacterized protein n=1 Tax=Sordaria brevicollis TaxID=83679 RepID=A0AAE0PK25_SORBR|nr:hypothetical protein B0T20DRAFT_115178 [Sordaria brevicollis]